jgi:hypothetical protein
MRTASVGNIERWLLASWMLTGALLPPVSITHAHENGGQHHRHDSATHSQIAATASHRTFETPGHADRECDSAASADVHQHVFLGWLGSVRCSPIPNPSDKPPPLPADGFSLPLVAACPSCPASAFSSPSWLSTSPPNSEKPIVQPPTQILGRGPSVAPTSALCDRARHERSGVQLA